MTTLTLLTAILVLAFFVILAYSVWKISILLESIGGNGDSFLAKLRFGLRAIEMETSHLGPEVTKINAGLTDIAGGLGAIDNHLTGTIDAVVKQGS